MPKIQFSDVIPPNRKRSIRDVPIPNGGKRKTPVLINAKQVPINKITPTTPISQTEVSGPLVKDFDSKMSEITEKKKTGAYEYYYPKEKSVEKENNTSTKTKKKQLIFGNCL